MTVVDIWCDGDYVAVHYGKSDHKTNNQFDIESLSPMQLLQLNAILCNRTTFDTAPENMKLPILARKTFGDASESALLKYWSTRHDFLTDVEIRALFPKIFELPFNSKNKYQVSIHKYTNKPNAARILFLKGAPERVFSQCSHIFHDSLVIPITDSIKGQFESAYEQFAERGERVLGFAYLSLDIHKFPPEMDSQYDSSNYPDSGYVFLGLMGLMDPPKVGVAEAIQKCKNAGIQVVMVTGYVSITQLQKVIIN